MSRGLFVWELLEEEKQAPGFSEVIPFSPVA